MWRLSPEPGTALAKPDPAVFDIDAWLSGAKLPEAVTRINLRADLVARCGELTAEHDALKAAGDTAGALEKAEGIEAIRAEMEGFWRSLRHRSLTPAEVEKLQDVKGDAERLVRQLAMTMLDPAMDDAAVRKLRDAIGAGQWLALVADSSEISFSRVVTPDFSLSVSSTLATARSSSR